MAIQHIVPTYDGPPQPALFASAAVPAGFHPPFPDGGSEYFINCSQDTAKHSRVEVQGAVFLPCPLLPSGHAFLALGRYDMTPGCSASAPDCPLARIPTTHCVCGVGYWQQHRNSGMTHWIGVAGLLTSRSCMARLNQHFPAAWKISVVICSRRVD